MPKSKIENSIFKILLEGVKIYCTNFLQFTRYMAFPVLGQLLGMGLIFGLAGVYTTNLPVLIEKSPAFNNFTTIVVCVILITVPGMIIFLKAFWDYLVAYGALNSMTDSAMNTGKVYDFPAHNAVITQKTFKFVALWFIVGLLSVLALNPFFIIIAAVFFIYFILVFQVFTFEEDVSVIGCFKRSLQIIKGNFARTFILMCIIGLFTHYLFVEGFSVFFDLTKVTEFLTKPFENWAMTNLPLDGFNNWLLNLNPRAEILTPTKVAQILIYQIAFFIVTGFTLPFRSICWTLWYKALGNSSEKTERKTVVKKLDKNILKRAKKKED